MRRKIGEAWTKRSEISRSLLRRCADGLLIFSLLACTREALDSRWNPNMGDWRETEKCGAPTYTIPDINNTVAVANQMEPFWFYDREEEAVPERDIDIVWQVALSADENTMVSTYSVTYAEDYGNSGIGLVFGTFLAVRPRLDVMMELGTTAYPHSRDVETVRLIAHRIGNSDQWILEKIVVNQHRQQHVYYFGGDSPLVCYQGNPALLVEQGKHVARVSASECNSDSLLNLLGLKIGQTYCQDTVVYHKQLTSDTEVPYLPDDQLLVEETITLNLGGELVATQPLTERCLQLIRNVCRASYDFGHTVDWLDWEWD